MKIATVVTRNLLVTLVFATADVKAFIVKPTAFPSVAAAVSISKPQPEANSLSKHVLSYRTGVSEPINNYDFYSLRKEEEEKEESFPERLKNFEKYFPNVSKTLIRHEEEEDEESFSKHLHNFEKYFPNVSKNIVMPVQPIASHNDDVKLKEAEESDVNISQETDGESFPERLKNFEKYWKELSKERPGFTKQFWKLRAAVRTEDGPLDLKTKELIALALSVAGTCDTCIAHHVYDAMEAGATREEIADMLGVVALMTGGVGVAFSTHVMRAVDQFEEMMKMEKENVKFVGKPQIA